MITWWMKLGGNLPPAMKNSICDNHDRKHVANFDLPEEVLFPWRMLAWLSNKDSLYPSWLNGTLNLTYSIHLNLYFFKIPFPVGLYYTYICPRYSVVLFPETLTKQTGYRSCYMEMIAFIYSRWEGLEGHLDWSSVPIKPHP